MNAIAITTEGQLQQGLLRHFEARKQPGSVNLEVGARQAYLAVTTRGFTRAFVAPCSPLNPEDCLGLDLLVHLPVPEVRNPEPCQVSPAFLKHLSPAPLFLAGEEGCWRERAQHYAQRLQASSMGEVLLGTYGSARGCISYNADAKQAFERDARRYLKKLHALIGRPAPEGHRAVSYCPAAVPAA